MTRERPYKGLPRVTQLFLGSPLCGDADVVVYRFHGWMKARGATLATLSPMLVRRYLANRRAEGDVTGYDFRGQLLRYLEHLYERHQLPFDPQMLRAPCKRRLPDTVVDYLAELRLTLAPSTCNGHRGTLRRFHTWLHQRGITPGGMTREHAVEFMQDLADRGLHPSTRTQAQLSVRAYLRWLEERGRLRRAPDELIRSSDRPKLPQYLPRPFPPEVDRELDRRLRAKLGIHAVGLRLMRRTGLRVGELARLPRNCTTADAAGQVYLKVPLGKLNTERLVPLDVETRRLVEYLVDKVDPGNPWLFPDRDGSHAPTNRFRIVLRDVADGLELGGPPATHRLRHTFATEMLNAGVSLVGVMKLLGHTDYRMTLRYAAVLPETVHREYHAAIAKIEASYSVVGAVTPDIDQPTRMLSDVIRALKRDAGEGDSAASRRLAALVKRLDAINAEVQALGLRRDVKHKRDLLEEK